MSSKPKRLEEPCKEVSILPVVSTVPGDPVAQTITYVTTVTKTVPKP